MPARRTATLLLCISIVAACAMISARSVFCDGLKVVSADSVDGISRAAFFQRVNSAFGFQKTVEVSFRDVKAGAWYEPVVSASCAAGYITGYEDGTVRPDAPITRREAAIVMSRILTGRSVRSDGFGNDSLQMMCEAGVLPRRGEDGLAAYGHLSAEDATAAVKACKSLAMNPHGILAHSDEVIPDELVPEAAKHEIMSGTISFKDDFEGSIGKFWYREMASNEYAGAQSAMYASSGSKSYRIELRKSDPLVCDSKRSELKLQNAEGPLENHTYKFAILLPKGGAEDYELDPEGSEIIAQWHNTPDPGEDWTFPPLALRTFNGHYVLERSWDDAALTTNAQMISKGNRATYDLGSYLPDKGRFVQWMFKIKWGWLDYQDPRIEIFKDGEKVLDVNGPNTTNDIRGNYMKLGIYKWDWAQGPNDSSVLSNRVIYYDSVSVE